MRDDAEKIKHAYNNVTYFMMGQLNINRENSLRLFVSSYTDSPSITDLQSVSTYRTPRTSATVIRT